MCAGADINARNREGDTPLICAVRFQLIEVIQFFTTMNAFPDIKVNVKNATGTTALHYAAAIDNKEITAILLQMKADIFVGNKSGKTPVHTACKYGSEKVLKLITEVKKSDIRQIVRDTDDGGNTPLMVAKSAVNYSAHNIDLLISCGSNINAFNHNHDRILHFYSNIDDKDTNENLLLKEQTLLLYKNYNRETALHIAAKHGHKDTCFLYAERYVSHKWHVRVYACAWVCKCWHGIHIFLRFQLFCLTVDS